MAHDPKDAPPGPKDAPPAVTPAIVRQFLARKSTMKRIAQVVQARCRGALQRADREAILSDVVTRALETKAPPDSPEGLRPWVSRMAQNLVVDFFRRRDAQEKWLRRDVDVDELPPDPVEAPEIEVSDEQIAAIVASDESGPPRPMPNWTLGSWVRLAIAQREEPHRTRDEQTFEMLRAGAEQPTITDEVLAATFGLTRDQYKHRLAAFKARYLPRRKRYVERRNTVLWFLVAAAVLAIAYLLFAPPGERFRIGADPDAKPLVPPAPSASLAPRTPPAPRNEALPTEPADGKKLP